MSNPSHALLPALLALTALPLTACVDSSIDESPPGVLPPAVDITPDSWKAYPGRIQTFQATDPTAIGLPVLWTVPPALKTLSVQPNDVTVMTTAVLGKHLLEAKTTAPSGVEGEAPVKTVGFGWKGSLGPIFPGDASHQPLADVAVRRGPVDPGTSRVFVAYLDEATGDDFVRSYDHAFTLALDQVPDRKFNRVQRPRITADAQGNAYWVEQFFDSGLPGGQRARRISRLRADGTLDIVPWDPAQQQGLQLCPGTDIASDDDGRIYMLCHAGLACLVVRFEDIFAGATQATVLGAITAPAPDVQLAVDLDGNLLVAAGPLLTRWTPDPGGTGASVEPLATLPSAVLDLDADAEGGIHVALASEVQVLDRFGDLLDVIDAAPLAGGMTVPFEALLGLGADGEGNLRLLDDPQVDDPTLGLAAARAFALDLGGL